MTTTDLLLLGTSIGLAGLGASLMTSAHPERRALGFPADTTAPQALTLLGAVGGFPARTRLTFETVSHDGEVSFSVLAAAADIRTLRAAAQGVLPGLRLAAAPELPDTTPRLRTRISWRGSHVLLRDDDPELAVAALLGVLQTTRRTEHVRLSVRLRPIVRPKAPRRRPQRPNDFLTTLATPPTSPIPSDELAQIRTLYGAPLINARLQLEIWAASPKRARALTRQVVAVLRSRSGRRGRFSARRAFGPAGVGTTMGVAQLLPLLAWPLEDPPVPGLLLQRAPILRVDRRIPRTGTGRSFGVPTWPGQEQRQLRQPPVGALSHALILGPSGSGKSTLLANLARDDIDGGRGALLLDMKGDTATDLMARIPAARRDDVVILDPSDSRPLPGLKSLDGSSPELTADLWVGIFRNLFADSWGIRTERYLRLGVQTLAYSDDTVITDLPVLFTDETLRRRLLSRITDPFLLSAWAAFDGLSVVQQSEHLSAPLGKAQDILGRRVLRGILGQPKPKVTIAEGLNARKIFIVRLSPGLVGPPTSQILGALVLYEIHQAVMARQSLAGTARTPFNVYIDEPAVLQLLPVPIDSLLELARGLGVGVTLATQSITQLPDRVRKAALTNAATLATFRPDIDDARLLAPRVSPATAQQLLNLAPFQIVLRLGLSHGTVAETTTAATPAPREAVANVRQLRDHSAARYGVDPDETHAQLNNRWQRPTVDNFDAPIGRRRRTS